MIRLWIHRVKDVMAVSLLFAAVCSLLGVVGVTTLELPVGENVGQWIWFVCLFVFVFVFVLSCFVLKKSNVFSFVMCLREAGQESACFEKSDVFLSFFCLCFMEFGALGECRSCLGIAAIVWFFRFRSLPLCTNRVFLQSGTVCRVFGNGAACLLALVSACS